MKKLSLLLVILFLTTFVRADENVESVRKIFKTAENTQLIFSDIDGNVTLNTNNGNEIIFTFNKEISEKDSAKSGRMEYFRDIKPVFEEKDGIVKIRIDYPKRKSGIFSSFFNVRVRIHSSISIPANIVLKVKTIDGNIEGKNLNNKMTFRTVDGNINLVDSKGSFSGITTDGNCKIRNFNGSLSHSSVDGNIDVAGIIDNVNLSTVDGNISVNFENGSTLSDNSKLKSVDGSVRVTVPEKFPVKIFASSVDGSININESAFDKIEKMSKKRVEVSTRNASYELLIRTVDGSIRLGNSR